jgi:predicted Zn-dependent peptidase
MREFKRLAEGISEEEIQRAQVGLKSALVMQSESSSSRAAGIAGDYYMLGRVRSLNEIKDNIEKTGVDSVLTFLRENKFRDFTAVTIGEKKVSLD